MKKIIYYVAASLDGYIAGPQGDISKFVHDGNGVAQYKADLMHFETVIMGRKTYEFGYQYGLEPGQPAYAHMQHHIFSNSLQFDSPSAQVTIEKPSITRVQEILTNASTNIYLCGGGEFAGWLLDHNLIDVLKLKLNPIILGNGTKLFGDSTTALKAQLRNRESYENGLEINTYDLK